MKINEIFFSIQGEGIYLGLPMVFIRVTGCNLRCKWCDTKYAYNEGTELTQAEIIEQIEKYPSREICLTGGEPMVHGETLTLIKRLIEMGYTLHLETNGSFELDSLPKSDNLKISMDIKCPSSDEEQKMKFNNLQTLGAGDQVKFIIMDDEDYGYAKDIINEYISDPAYAVIFTPCSRLDAENAAVNITEHIRDLRKLAEKVMTDKLQVPVRVLPQLHKLIWPDRVRGV